MVEACDQGKGNGSNGLRKTHGAVLEMRLERLLH